MSSIDDIDEVVIASVQTTSLTPKKQCELEETKRAEKAAQTLTESFIIQDSNSNQVNGNVGRYATTDSEGNTVKISKLFPKLKTKLDPHKNYLPKTPTEPLPHV
jgi:hypothetical protein